MVLVEVVLLLPYMLLAGPHSRARLVAAWRHKKQYMAIVGLGPALTYLVILYALTLAKASYVTALRELAVVFGAIFGAVFLKEEINIGTVVGGASIVCGLLLIKAS